MTAPSTEVVQHDPHKELVSQLRSDQFQHQVALALPEQVSPNRFVRATITALNQNPDLADPTKCELNSVFTAVLRAAQDGLLPDGREAAIAIYKGKAQYLPMIGGYRKIAGDHGWQIAARVVYANDVFEYEQGLEPKLRHVPVRPGAERGERIAAYATATHVSGAKAAPVVMYADEVGARKAVAQTDRVWKAWTDRMWEKTVGKALFKELPIGDLDPRVARVIAAEDVTPDQAKQLMYGNGNTPALGEAHDQPADGRGLTAPNVQPDQQAEATSAHTPPPGVASAPDFDDEPPADGSPFQPPAGAVNDAKLAADSAGNAEVVNGGNKGLTIAQVAAKSNGPGWIEWCITKRDHPNSKDAELYARVHQPEAYQKAMAELETAAQ